MTCKHPRVGVGVFVIKDEKILMKKRKGSHGSGDWSLSGGYLEYGESLEECARRETKEEFNVNIKNIRVATVTNDIFKKEEKHFVTIFMKSEYAGGEPKNNEPDKSETISWFTWDDLPTPLFLPLKNLKKTGFNPFN